MIGGAWRCLDERDSLGGGVGAGVTMLVLTHKHPFNASRSPTVPHYDVVSYLTHLDP